jgi:hypothetical protein
MLDGVHGRGDVHRRCSGLQRGWARRPNDCREPKGVSQSPSSRLEKGGAALCVIHLKMKLNTKRNTKLVSWKGGEAALCGINFLCNQIRICLQMRSLSVRTPQKSTATLEAGRLHGRPWYRSEVQRLALLSTGRGVLKVLLMRC